jgi:hypothetical protein
MVTAMSDKPQVQFCVTAELAAAKVTKGPSPHAAPRSRPAECEMRGQAATDRAPAPSGLAPALASIRGCLDGLHKIGAVREAKIRTGPTVSTL